MASTVVWHNNYGYSAYADWGSWSAHALLLGYLEQQPLYNAANFNLGVWITPGYPTNQTVALNFNNTFICPSDGICPLIPSNGLRWGGWNHNYFASAGSSTFPGISSNKSLSETNGLFQITAGKVTSFSSVTDGTSKTNAFGEALIGQNDARNRFRTGVFPDPPNAGGALLYASSNPKLVIQDLETCMAAYQAGTRLNGCNKGSRWAVGGVGTSLFNTIVPPSSSQYPFDACTFFTGGGTDGGEYQNANSNHPGGANFAFGDGSVHFIKSSISMPTYWALGSRNGGELLSSDSY